MLQKISEIYYVTEILGRIILSLQKNHQTAWLSQERQIRFLRPQKDRELHLQIWNHNALRSRNSQNRTQWNIKIIKTITCPIIRRPSDRNHMASARDIKTPSESWSLKSMLAEEDFILREEFQNLSSKKVNLCHAVENK